jgi:hypothetical protein
MRSRPDRSISTGLGGSFARTAAQSSITSTSLTAISCARNARINGRAVSGLPHSINAHVAMRSRKAPTIWKAAAIHNAPQCSGRELPCKQAIIHASKHHAQTRPYRPYPRCRYPIRPRRMGETRAGEYAVKRKRKAKPAKRSALSMQQIGGRARAKALTPERRIEIAKAASEARWRKAQEPAE